MHLRSALEPGRPRGSPGRYVARRGDGSVLAVEREQPFGIRRILREQGPLSRAELVRASGLARPTVMAIVARVITRSASTKSATVAGGGAALTGDWGHAGASYRYYASDYGIPGGFVGQIIFSAVV